MGYQFLDDVPYVFRQYQLGKVQPPKHTRPRKPVRAHGPPHEEPSDRPDAPRKPLHLMPRPPHEGVLGQHDRRKHGKTS